MLWFKRLLSTPTALSTARLTVLRQLNFSPRLILDIGAYQGSWAKHIHKIFPKAQVFLIEANQDHQSRLEKLTWVSGFEITLLGEKTKSSVNYYANKNTCSAGNSIFKEQTHFFDDSQIRQLPMVTLDSIVKKHHLTNIDFLKIDAQGSELNILKGANKAIAQTEFILLETQNLTYNQNAPHINQVFPFMEKLGFKLFDVTQIHYLPSGEMAQLDLLFVKQTSKFFKKGILF